MSNTFEIDSTKLEGHFSEMRIKRFMEELELTRLEAILYLWFYNNVGISEADRRRNNGRDMYRKFAKGAGGILKEAVCKEK